MLSTWWQQLPLNIDPVIFRIFGLEIRYYGLMYIVSFLTVYALVRWRIKKQETIFTSKHKVSDLLKQTEDLFLWAMLGLLIGARVGYFLFYQTSILLTKPWLVIWPFGEAGNFIGFAGMSFHGGLIGVIIAGYLFIKKYNYSFQNWAELVIPAIPLGYTWGRIGNWLNGELWGRPTTSPVGQVFASDPDQLVRHPSQLYEAGLEGFGVFLILWPLRNNAWVKDNVLGLYLVLYSIARFISEFYRQPDAHLGLRSFSLTTGQYLALGTVIIFLAYYLLARAIQSNSRKQN